jgi:CRP-like cAMP-binding protein
MIKGVSKPTCEICDWAGVIQAHAALHVRYPPGELIYQTGSYAAGIYIVSTGLVCERLTPKSDRGTNAVCEILGAGDLIGFEIITSSGGSTYPTTARSITETDLFFLERRAFQQLLETDPSLPTAVLAYLGRRLLHFKRFVGCQPAPLPYRVCQLLLMLADKSGVTRPDEIASLPEEMTPNVLAEILNVSKRKILHTLDALPKVRCNENGIALLPEALHLWQTSPSEDSSN